MLVLGFSFGGFFVIIAKTSFIYIEYFKIPTEDPNIVLIERKEK